VKGGAERREKRGEMMVEGRKDQRRINEGSTAT